MGAAAADGTVSGSLQYDKPVDEESKKGKFGWFEMEKFFLPLILPPHHGPVHQCEDGGKDTAQQVPPGAAFRGEFLHLHQEFLHH